jgi:SPP1 gp7 family putative phage head morphogenesis protein
MNFPDDAYTARAETIVERTIERAFPLYADLRQHLLGLIRSATDYDRARELLEDHGADVKFIKENAELLFESLATIDATGRSFVVEKDRFFSQGARRPAAGFQMAGVIVDYLDLGWFACADNIVRISFDLIPRTAVEYLRKKSLTIAGIENDELLKAVQARLVLAAKEGKTYSEFETEVDQVFESFGVEPLRARHIQTVFRTNLYSAYSIGQLEQVSLMKESFPLWRYVAVLDSATRPDHRALNGKIFRVGDGPYPPIDYNCRCSAQHLHELEVKAQNLTPSDSPNLPSKVRRFDVHSDFDRWAAGKKKGMNPGIREKLDRPD